MSLDFTQLEPTERISPLHRLCRARDLIRDCFNEPISLDDCAFEAGLSPWHLLRSFRAAFGETPKEYLTRLRLKQAQHLLTVSSRSVTEVCLDVGFSSLGTFSLLFKRHLGCSPKEFRKEVRGWVTVPGVAPWVYVPYCFASRFGGTLVGRAVPDTCSSVGHSPTYESPA
jgi:AraC-like DNA-binding protein